MGEKLYTIPVNDAFDKECECPVCEMYHLLETSAIEFTMGPSYMEDDVRLVTDKIGFCENHLKLLYLNQNRLGLGLMMLTHMNKVIAEAEKATKSSKAMGGGLFKKKESAPIIVNYFNKLEQSCYICNRMEGMFRQYIATIFHLYQNDEEFRKKYNTCKGFCNKHYALLYEKASEYLRSNLLEQFIKETNQLYLENMKRVRDELEWFTDKFDYQNVDKPWNNSKDALPRALQKMNSIFVEGV